MKIKKGMHIEYLDKIWIIRSIVNNLVMITEKGKPKGTRCYINVKCFQQVPAWGSFWIPIYWMYEK